MTPADRRRAVEHVRQVVGISERRACELVAMHRSSQRYRARRKGDEAVRSRIVSLARGHRRWGYRMVHDVLRRAGWGVNHKRVRRIYVEEGLQIRRRRRKKLDRSMRRPILPVERLDQVWAMDFVTDSLVDGRRIRALAIVDQHSRQCLGLEVASSLPAARVVRVLDRLKGQGRRPETVVVDNGPEFTSALFGRWAEVNGVEIRFIQPGRPMQNAFAESFIGRMRDECLNEHWFLGLDDAREAIEGWRLEYNHERPKRSLGRRTPDEVAHRAGLRASPPRSAQLAPQPRSIHPGNLS